MDEPTVSNVSFNIYSWMDTFHIQPNHAKLIDTYNWISIMLKIVPEYVRSRICLNTIFIEIPTPFEIRNLFRSRGRISELTNLRENNLREYVFIAKQAALMNPYYTPNKLVLVIEDNEIVDDPVTELNPFADEDIHNCIEPIILISVGIITRRGLKILSSHANVLIIDKIKRTYELFDPYGKTSEIINQWFETDFRQIADLEDYTYLSPMVLCPNLGPQSIAERTEPIPKTEKGYCMSYTFMYIQMRLANPHLEPQQIVELLLSKPPAELRLYAFLYNTILHQHYGWPLRD